ncbi:MAG: site-specific integrase [Acidobacteriaceae bacterium]
MKLDSFIEYLSTQTKSTETLRAYRQDLTRFGVFLKDKGLRTNQVKRSTIADYIRHLEDTKGRAVSDSPAPATIARHLSVIAAYYEWRRGDSDLVLRNPVEGFRRPKVRNEKPSDVDDSVLAKLVDGIIDLRDRAIVLLFVYSGLRLSELRQLDKTTITLTKKKQPDGSLQYFGSGEVIGKGEQEAVVSGRSEGHASRRHLHRREKDGGRSALPFPVIQKDSPEQSSHSANRGQVV